MNNYNTNKEQILYKIQNWSITVNGVVWNGAGETGYCLSRAKLVSSGRGDRTGTIDYLVSIAEKSWIHIDDLYALNTAFIKALSLYEIELPQNISLKKTIDLQLDVYNSR